MSDYTFNLPDVGEGVAEAEIEEWYVEVGTAVERDQPLLSVLTDKVTLELTSPVAGTVAEIGPSAGERVTVGSLLVQFGGAVAPDPARDGEVAQHHGGTASLTTDDAKSKAGSAPSATPGGASHNADDAPPTATPTPRLAASPPARSRPATGVRTGPLPASRRVLAAPAVRRRAMEAGVDLRLVPGSGPAERIGHEDLDAYLQAPGAGIPTVGVRPNEAVEEIPVTGVRRVIAERMAVSKSRIPHITIVEEVDVTALEELRTALTQRDTEGPTSLTPLAFIALALVRAVADHPVVNARFDDERNVVYRYGGVHIGIATQTTNGLMVPVVRHAEVHSLWDMAAEIVRISSAAREGRLGRDEMAKSTITITSLGALGGLITTPVINHPEVAIVGINRRQTRPVWDGRDFIPRQMMNISCGFDHRIVDGWDAATFMQRVKQLLETPALLFLKGK